ncbi:MAG: GspH/FimT family pseudopilin [Burkholderiales bacterium]|jgi:MSHA pilin protein MshC|nr:prepilin-type N-terminal cleavage/methylation domain-containing protein [Chloroflexota bacterium]MBE7461791.1 prepilin-type N-terminal cleavage/methylation domain-containing protein [Zoogloeaceae bacterium]MCE7990312.1 prepilin-type N-terminal cleavage/methylation domain-containing protein [Caldilinea sp. CFX5]MCQ3924993.1 general secretion pathway protein GspH [Rhodocyclaceae bacterium]MCZ2115238.1 GspH/FimT family pseudopilin [Anaerolineae bacterium]MCZ2419101.1 GspH/FimT family pseudopil
MIAQAFLPLHRLLRQKQGGMTVVELITVIVILGILAAIALPRFVVRNSFDQRGFRDQVVSSIRFARQEAIAMRREVCVSVITATPASLALTFNPSNVPGAACSQPVLAPGSSAPYVVTAPFDVVLTSTATDFRFNGLGQPVPNGAVSLTVAGTLPINIALETGHVSD